MNAKQLTLLKGRPSEVFERFWTNYPRKVGRIPASRLWNRLKPPLDEVLEGVKAWTGSKEWEDPYHVPHPTTFLAQERWKERPIAARKESAVGAHNSAYKPNVQTQIANLRWAASLPNTPPEERARIEKLIAELA